MHSFNVLSEWLAWRLDDGKLIRVGEYPIVGSTNFYKLSTDLLNFFMKKGYFIFHK